MYSFWFAALAEDYNVRDTACDDTFHMFKYCGFNGSGFLLSLLTYFILKTGEAARARGVSLSSHSCAPIDADICSELPTSKTSASLSLASHSLPLSLTAPVWFDIDKYSE